MAIPRRTMTFRRVRLDSAAGADARLGSTVDERLAMVTQLSIAAWTASGRPLPSYARKDIPVCIEARLDRVRARD